MVFQRLLTSTTGRSMRHRSLHGLTMKTDSYTALVALSTLRAMAKGNGLVMLKKSIDPNGALLARGYSLAQLLMGRQPRTSIPVIASTQRPRWGESKQLRDRQDNTKTRQTVDYDRYHRGRPWSTLRAGDSRWVQYANIMAGYSGWQGRHALFDLWSLSFLTVNSNPRDRTAQYNSRARREPEYFSNNPAPHVWKLKPVLQLPLLRFGLPLFQWRECASNSIACPDYNMYYGNKVILREGFEHCSSGNLPKCYAVRVGIQPCRLDSLVGFM